MSMIRDEIKKRIPLAMKEKREVEKEILKLALGEIQTAEARSGREPTDEEAAQIVRKLIKSNEETIGNTADAGKKSVLEEENRVLSSLLPKGLSQDEIVSHLAPVRDAIASAGNDGQATGVAMKHLKGLGLTVPGQEVSAAVKTIRTPRA